MFKISVIIPVKNEELTIARLLEALLAQTRIPDDIIITDGGSADKTVSIIKEYAHKNSSIKLICLPEAFPGKGRNSSIARSGSDIIASIDAGCEPVKNWLEELIKPFEADPEVKVVYGRYKPAVKTLLEKCFVLATEPSGYDFSVASMAHKKEVWEKVGGYPEDLRSGEDTVFKSKIRDIGSKAVINCNALMYWQPRSNIPDFFMQFYNHANSSGRLGLRTAFYARKIIFISIFMLFTIIGIFAYPVFLFFAAALYMIWMSFTMIKHYDRLSDIKITPMVYLTLPAVFFTRDMAQVCGYVTGLMRRFIKTDRGL